MTVGKFDFLDFFKSSLFWSKNHSFISGMSKNDFSGLFCPENTNEKKNDFFDKARD